MTTTTTIRGILCEIESNIDRDGFDCFVSKGSYSASLACLSDVGCLTDGEDRELPVSAETIAHIERWANLNGYDS